MNTQRHFCAVLIVGVATVSMGACANAGGSKEFLPPPSTGAQRITDVPGGNVPRDQDLAGRSVDAALRWLAAHQDRDDGHWSAAGFDVECGKLGDDVICDAKGNPEFDLGVTGLSLLAFLGAGHTHKEGRYKLTVKAGLRYLVDVQQRNGNFGNELNGKYTYDHIIATLAMVEAYALTKDYMFKASAENSLAYMYATRNKTGAWSDAQGTAGMDPHVDDLLVTSWAISAMSLARDLSLPEDEAALEAAMHFTEERTASHSNTTASRNGAAPPVREASESADHASDGPNQSVATAVGIFSRLRIDRDLLRSGNREFVEAGVASMMRLPPTWDTAAPSRRNLHEWYYGTYALYLYGGEDWEAWRQALVPAVTRHQHRKGELQGSWDPQDGHWGEEGGRVYSTALLALTMEVCASAREPPPRYAFYDYLKARISGEWLGHPVATGHRELSSSPLRVTLTFEPNVSIPQYAPLDESWPIGSVEILTGSQKHLAHVYRIRECRDLFGFDGYTLEATESTSRPLDIDNAPGWLITLRSDGDSPRLELGQFMQGGLSQLPAESTVDWPSLVDVAWTCERLHE